MFFVAVADKSLTERRPRLSLLPGAARTGFALDREPAEPPRPVTLLRQRRPKGVWSLWRPADGRRTGRRRRAGTDGARPETGSLMGPWLGGTIGRTMGEFHCTALRRSIDIPWTFWWCGYFYGM